MELERREAQASSSQRRISNGDGDRVEEPEVGAPVAIGPLEMKPPEKRKRGRPPRGQAKPVVAAADEEEDVCFICFDGGSLVLCDRRNCPKAYHPACIKRDEAFFRSRAKWNCGWHICSTCEKASHYMCYTCTYSLCKGCTKDADYVCVRGTKGFCGTCMKTILLIEKFEENKEAVQVDFDDRSSWEYLFKVYWVLLKGNLSLTKDELLNATNPWKGTPVSTYWGSSGNPSPDLEVLNAKRRKINTMTNILITPNSSLVEKSSGDINWASRELLEFVAHVRNGDTSVMSQFDVQNLFLDYIKRNKLCDPQQKCEIICDSRLLSMFGQARLGHLEMLKLLESHCLIKDDVSLSDTVTTRFVNDKRCTIQKRSDEKGLLDDPCAFAMIDFHNINLIFLRRNLLENLIDDAERFHEKVVGAIVRIRIFTGDLKPDIHRLVRVVGTSKRNEPYKIGTKETNFMLEISNIDKKEVIAIDGVSNENFSQDECERLRQSIKFGLIRRFTVGEIKERAIALQEVKLNDWLESEVVRLNHLRDQAIEKSHKKEVREYEEKLELLNSVEERKRMIEEVPVVHTDPNMDPIFDFDQDTIELDPKKQDNKVKTRKTGSGRKKRASVSPRQAGSRHSHSTGTNQCAEDLEMQKIWQYQDPTGKIQGPFYMLQLRKWSSSGHFPPELRIWRLNERSEDSILLTDALSGQCSKEQLSLFEERNLKPSFDDRKISIGDDGQSRNVEASPLTYKSVMQRDNLQLDDPSINLNEPSRDLGNLEPSKKLVNLEPSKNLGKLELNMNLEPSTNHGNHELSGNIGNLEPSRNLGDLEPSKNLGHLELNMNLKPSKNLGNLKPCVNRQNLEANKNLEPSRNLRNLEVSNEAVGSEGLCSNLSGTTTLAVANLNDEHSMSSSETWHSLKGRDDRFSRPQPSTSLSPPDSQTPPHQIGKDFFDRKPDQNDVNLSVRKNPDCETRTKLGCMNRSDGEDHSGQSSGHSQTNDRESNFAVNSVSKSLEQKQAAPEVPKPGNECWSTDARPQEVSKDSVGFSAGPTELPVEDWLNSRNHAATPASLSDHLTPSSPSRPHSNTPSWDDLVPDPDEFSSLMNESVSDLLAEVEAMESLHALSCHRVLTEGSKTECISPVSGFSPAPELARAEADAQSSVMDEPLDLEKSLTCHPAIGRPELEANMKNNDVSINQWDVNTDLRPPAPVAPAAPVAWDLEIPDVDPASWGSVQTDTPMGWDAGLDWARPVPPPPLPPQLQNPIPQPPPQPQNPSPSPPPQNPIPPLPLPNPSPSPPPQPQNPISPPPLQNPSPPPPPQNPIPSSSVGILGSQPRHSGERYAGHRERGYNSRDSSSGRNRHGWSRQPVYSGGSGGGGSYRSQSKGRVCKYYESGYCKRGASCSYFHS